MNARAVVPVPVRRGLLPEGLVVRAATQGVALPDSRRWHRGSHAG